MTNRLERDENKASAKQRSLGSAKSSASFSPAQSRDSGVRGGNIDTRETNDLPLDASQRNREAERQTETRQRGLSIDTPQPQSNRPDGPNRINHGNPPNPPRPARMNDNAIRSKEAAVYKAKIAAQKTHQTPSTAQQTIADAETAENAPGKTAPEADKNVRATAAANPENQDIRDWLEMTHFHDDDYRIKRLTKYRNVRHKLIELERQRAEIEKELHEDLEPSLFNFRTPSIAPRTSTEDLSLLNAFSPSGPAMAPPPPPQVQEDNGIKIKDSAPSPKKRLHVDEPDYQQKTPPTKIQRTNLPEHVRENVVSNRIYTSKNDGPSPNERQVRGENANKRQVRAASPNERQVRGERSLRELRARSASPNDATEWQGTYRQNKYCTHCKKYGHIRDRCWELVGRYQTYRPGDRDFSATRLV